jgi:hypothetical protein
MELSEWIVRAHGEVGTRLRSQVLSRVPYERWAERPCDRSASVGWLLWHATRHEDVAIHVVARGGQDVLSRHGWVERVGAAGFAPGVGLSESEDRTAAVALVPAQLDAYADAVRAETSRWLATLDTAELERVPDAAAALASAGVDLEEYSWLRRMWEAKPVAFHVQWEATGHGYLHLGEMVHLRNELGLGGR